MRVKLRPVRALRRTGIAQYAKACLLTGSETLCDRLSCYAAETSAICRHTPLITGSGRQAAQHPVFKWANTMPRNLENALLGTCHALHEQHVPRYRAEFEYRFNRRFDLTAMIERLIHVALPMPPMPCRLLMMAWVYG